MRSLSLPVGLAIVLATSVTYAQSDPVKVQALKRYREAVAFHEKGQDEEAYLQLTQAFAVMQTPPILFNLARTEQLTGRRIDAAVHFRAYLASPDNPLITKELRGKAQAFLAELNGQLAHLVVDLPAGAVLSVDEKDVAGPAVDVAPGAHTLAARLGEQRASVQVTALAGVQTAARLAFEVAAAAPGGALTVLAPPPPSDSGPDQHPGSKAYGVSTAGTVVRWGLSGLAVVGIGAGIGFALESQSKSDDVQAFRTSHPGPCVSAGSATCAQYTQLQSNETQAGTLAWVSYGVGGAAAVGAIAAWIFWPKQGGETAHVSVVPSVGPGFAGAQVGGTF
jgi:hypothetical protein